MLPFELATALLTAGRPSPTSRLGIGALVLLVVVLGVFHHLARTGVKAYERGEELGGAEELGTLQVGVLTTVLQTLSMRDPMTARHSAAVARYSREVARVLGLHEREQDLIHTAALLHDIGKFILPDDPVRRPQADRRRVGADQAPPRAGREARRADRRLRPGGRDRPAPPRAVRRRRLPAGIAGEEIPLGARIIAAADTYDVMTSRDSYRSRSAPRPPWPSCARGRHPIRPTSPRRSRHDPRAGRRVQPRRETDFESELDARSIKRRPPRR